MTSIRLPEEIDGCPVTRIESCFLEHNENVEKVIIPSTVTEIGHGAFFYCKSLNTVGVEGIAESECIIPESVKNIAHIANYCKEQLYYKRNIKSMTVQRTLFELNLYGFNSLNYRDYVRLDDFIRFLNINLKIRDKIYKVFFSICKFFWKILIR